LKISDFTNISSGVVVTSKNRQHGTNGPVIIQAGDVQDDGSISEPEFSLKEHANLEGQALTIQDVLLISRGQQNRAIPVRDEQVGMVASNSFLVIMVLANHGVMPEYLAWFLNSEKGQKRLSEVRRGSNIMYISKKGLSGIEVDVPDMNDQKRIVEMVHLKSREQEILKQIAGNRKKLIEQVMFNYIQKKSTR
jgi:restriction endonuclease S subunit